MLPTPTSFRPQALVGTTLDGRYRLIAHLASGGMGAVYRAEQVYMRKPVAVKLLRPELSSLPDIAERFRREAEIAASLEHEHIVRVTDFGRSPEGWLFLAMELLDGESLFDRLAREQRLPAPEVARLVIQVCRGLEAAHRLGVVHRDLKPENVFLTRPGARVKLLDFGIAKLSVPSSICDTQAGVVVGTPEYLSPEQATGATVDGRADIYSVGLVAWRMLVGHHPFQADDARGLMMMQATRPVPPLLGQRPGLAAWPGLVDAVERACAKDPAARQPSAAQLADELEAALASGPPASAPTPPAAGATPPAAPSVTAGPTPSAPAAPLPAPTAIAITSPPPPPRATAPVPVRRRDRQRLLASAVLAVLLAIPAVLAFVRWRQERPVADARALLAASRPDAARDLVAQALLRRPDDARLRVLHARALHRIDGQGAASVDAYAAALDLDARALDAAALEDLAANLADPALADRSARLLLRAGAPAIPVVIAATRTGPGVVRVRALELARDLGAEGTFDAAAAWTALLDDPECDVRRAAARRLGDLGNPAALPRLRELSRQTTAVKGLLGFPQHVPACGAAEAAAAVRRLGGDAAAPQRASR